MPTVRAILPSVSVLSALLCLLPTGHSLHAADRFPDAYNTEKPGREPMSAEAAAKSFRLPPCFKVSVFASEPDVRQPIAMAFDPRGRLWVAENYTYAEAAVKFATNLSDRVLIFEDADHDGRFDKRTVFFDRAKILTSVETGYGGAFLLCPPQLLFVADKNGDDIPDGEPEVLLDGFDTGGGNHHTFANGLKWGPDGWLWGRVGISSQANIGRPGTPGTNRVVMNGGIWRYHPVRRVIEAVSHGTTNPWGLDWNAEGEPFFINTVIGHFWHAIPGAHFQRMHGADVNPHSYELIPQHADHYHFDTGQSWTKSRASQDGTTFAAESDNLGGGHAHSGLMIYQGDNWPAAFRGKVFTVNLHGRRLNVERIERRGSGYVARHEPDLFQSGDPWFRGLDLIQGPDGGVFLSDWSDTGECHEHDGVHRSSGRIYKITYGDPAKPVFGDLTRLSGQELLPLLTGSNEWTARQARQVLATRTAREANPAIPLAELTKEFGRHSYQNRAERLRVLWALNAVGGPSTDWLVQRITGATRDGDEHLRLWAVRLLAERVGFSVDSFAWPSVEKAFLDLAKNDPAPSVRLALASALPKLPTAARVNLAQALLAHAGDASDHNLPLMLWYGVEPLVSADPASGVRLALIAEIPTVRRLIARRLGEAIESRSQPVTALLQGSLSKNPALRTDLLQGFAEAWRGWRKLPEPEGWAAFRDTFTSTTDATLNKTLAELDLLFGSGRALDELRAVVADGQADANARRTALRALLDAGAPDLAPLLKPLVGDPMLRADIMVGLLQLGAPEAPGLALGQYPWIVADERARVLGAMVTRSAAARALLDALADGRVPKAHLTPFHARQIAGLNDAALTARLGDVWGTVATTAADKRASIEKLRAELFPETLRQADLAQGRRLYEQACAACHRLYGEGGSVGPDLTGSGRANLDYLLENIVDPGAVVAATYRMTVLTLKDGRVLNGVVTARTDRTLTLQTQTETATLERTAIEEAEESTASMMPEGLLESLSARQRRDLVAYLMHPAQVPGE